jgi:hypothetical protein
MLGGTMATDEPAETDQSRLERCGQLGRVLVADDKVLRRLLTHLGIDAEDDAVGDGSHES